MQLTEHFNSAEFKCKCGDIRCTAPAVVYYFVEKLELVRGIYGKPMIVTSGSRCREYNATLENSSPYSSHLQGLAADFWVSASTDRYDLVAAAMTCGITGIGISDKFVHLDLDHLKHTLWTY